MEGNKTCSVCKENKEIILFTPSWQGWRHSFCDDCKRAKYRARNNERNQIKVKCEFCGNMYGKISIHSHKKKYCKGRPELVESDDE